MIRSQIPPDEQSEPNGYDSQERPDFPTTRFESYAQDKLTKERFNRHATSSEQVSSFVVLQFARRIANSRSGTEANPSLASRFSRFLVAAHFANEYTSCTRPILTR
jgi:hypothetical protein